MNILNSDRISLSLRDWRLQFGMLTQHFLSNYLGHYQLGSFVQYILIDSSMLIDRCVHSAKNESIMEIWAWLWNLGHACNLPTPISRIAVFIGMLINI